MRGCSWCTSARGAGARCWCRVLGAQRCWCQGASARGASRECVVCPACRRGHQRVPHLARARAPAPCALVHLATHPIKRFSASFWHSTSLEKIQPLGRGHDRGAVFMTQNRCEIFIDVMSPRCYHAAVCPSVEGAPAVRAAVDVALPAKRFARIRAKCYRLTSVTMSSMVPIQRFKEEGYALLGGRASIPRGVPSIRVRARADADRVGAGVRAIRSRHDLRHDQGRAGRRGARRDRHGHQSADPAVPHRRSPTGPASSPFRCSSRAGTTITAELDGFKKVTRAERAARRRRPASRWSSRSRPAR